jgi:isopentenyl-diphosphate Delta-isomerase
VTSSRKDEHVRYAVDQQRVRRSHNDFDDVAFLHHALAGSDCAQVSLQTNVAGRVWAAPLYISAMTGGSQHTGEINRGLAAAAAETGLAIAAGSMSLFLHEESTAETFRVLRTENPSGFVMANVNANTTVDQARRAVDLLCADALQVHLNAVQEIVMPEGDRSFTSWRRQIDNIVAGVEVPVIVKEVGFGLSRQTVSWLRDSGVAAADVAGCGGTNFASIENIRRRDGADYSFIESWGQSTPACLIDAAHVTGIDLLGSGGVRSPLDTVRALALGASATGIAGRFLLELLDHGITGLISLIGEWLEQLRQVMAILGSSTPAELRHTDVILTGNLDTYCRQRRIDTTLFAFRSPTP